MSFIHSDLKTLFQGLVLNLAVEVNGSHTKKILALLLPSVVLPSTPANGLKCEFGNKLVFPACIQQNDSIDRQSRDEA